jgi:cystathionine beta-lyase
VKYDFETIIDRTGKDAVAVESIPVEGSEIDPGFTRIPMWVADMNFATAPAITEAIIERAKHPLFGYFLPSDAYFDAIIGWQRDRNGMDGIKKEHIGYQNGVLGGVISAMSVLCGQGGSVLLNSPTYIGFTKALENAGYNIVLSPHVPRWGWRMAARLRRHGAQNKRRTYPHGCFLLAA